MAETERLSSRISNSLERHQRELTERQKLVDGTMKELLEQRERFAAVARRILESVIHPGMEELARHFDNAAIIDSHGETDFHCVCKFAHIPRFPATAYLDISLLPGESPTSMTTHYALQIFPVLMEYKHDEDMTFPLDGPDEAIGVWVEDKMVEFIDTYLRLETHPIYQKDNMVSDPVCGMQISAAVATSRVEWSGQTFYFCSERCKGAFLKDHK